MPGVKRKRSLPEALSCPVLVHVTEDVGELIERRANEAGLKKAAFVRQLIMRGLGLLKEQE